MKLRIVHISNPELKKHTCNPLMKETVRKVRKAVRARRTLKPWSLPTSIESFDRSIFATSVIVSTPRSKILNQLLQ